MILSHPTFARGSGVLIVLLSTLLASLAGCSLSPTDSPTFTDTTDTTDPKNTKDAEKFLVIAHRGASGYRPEHTLAGYQLAITQGADFIEPDLVPTKDGVLIARHENALALVKLLDNGQIERNDRGEPTLLSATTDVAERPEFAHLLRIRQIDNRTFAGWFSEDFTFAEIQTLFARERIPQLRPDNSLFTNLRIPSLDQILDLVEQPGNSHVGIYPELKHPTHFQYGKRHNEQHAIGIDTAKLLTARLVERAFTDVTRLYIQCFEVATLRRLKHQLLPAAKLDAPLVQLISRPNFELPDVQFHQTLASSFDNPDAYLQTVYGPLAESLAADGSYQNLLAQLSTLAADYAAGVGPHKTNAGAIAFEARQLGLELHPYTVRAEAYFLSKQRGAVANSVNEELATLKALGATGVFIDQPDLAVQWRSQSSQSSQSETAADAADK